MVRIVSTGRLRRLEQDVVRAGVRARAAQGRSLESWRRHAQHVRFLIGCVESAESDAAILREHVAHFEDALKQATAAVDALETDLAQARAAAKAPRSVVVLLHWGDVHSVHASVHDAKERAASHGADPEGWTPPTGLPARRVAWSTVIVTVAGGVPCRS